MTSFMDNYDPDLVPTQEFKILHNLTTDPEASAADAVQQILDLTIAELLSKDDTSGNDFDGDVPWNVSTLIVEIATNTAPSQQIKLLDFLSQIQKVTVTDPRTGEKVGFGSFGYLWTDLHSFGMHTSDALNSCVHNDTYTSRDLERSENIIAFAAQCTAASVSTGNTQIKNKMDFSIYGLYAFQNAFEKENQYKTAVRAACIWFIYAAGSMWESCKIKQGYKLNHPVKREFNMDKWHAWKLGLVFTRAGSGDESTQQLIRMAREQISRAESERLN